MSLYNFIPEVWAARILNTLEKIHVLGAVANRNYEGQITGFGDTVKIQSIGAIATAAYTRASTITPAALNDMQLKLLIDQARSFAFFIDDIDKAQGNPAVMEMAMKKAAYALKDVADAYLAGLYAQAGATLSNTDIAASNVIDWILSIGEKLDDNNVPSDGRFLILPPSLSTKLVKARVVTETQNSQILDNGIITRALGFTLYKSNNLTKVGNYTNVLAGTADGLSFAEQLVKLEGYRPEGKFADAVKGLHVYGGKVVDANCFICAPGYAVAEE